MKKILLGVIVLTSMSSFAADKASLVCTTPGDALSSVELVDVSSGPVLSVYKLDDSVSRFKILSSLRNINKGDSDTLIASAKKSIDFGGAITDSVLIRVLPGQKKAIMAMDGVVYKMDCHK